MTPPLPVSLFHIICKGIKQDWPQFWTLGDTPGAWPQLELTPFPTNDNLVIQPGFYPKNRAPTQALSKHFIHGNVVKNGDKGSTEVHMDTSSLSLIPEVTLSWNGVRLVTQDLPFTAPGPLEVLHKP